MQIVIGIVGEKGAGKQTFAEYLIRSLPSRKITHMRFSDLLRDTLTMWDLPHTRSNMQKVAIAFNGTFGEGTLSHALFKRIETDPADVVILDGVRWLSDEKLIRTFKKNFIVYITADAKTRYTRIKKRNEKIGESDLSFEQFVTEEKVKTETYIPQIGRRADIKIDNNGSFDDLKLAVENWSAGL